MILFVSGMVCRFCYARSTLLCRNLLRKLGARAKTQRVRNPCAMPPLSINKEWERLCQRFEEEKVCRPYRVERVRERESACSTLRGLLL